MASAEEIQHKPVKEDDEETYSLTMELVMGIALPRTMQATLEWHS